MKWKIENRMKSGDAEARSLGFEAVGSGLRDGG